MYQWAIRSISYSVVWETTPIHLLTDPLRYPCGIIQLLKNYQPPPGWDLNEILEDPFRGPPPPARGIPSSYLYFIHTFITILGYTLWK